MNFLFKETSFPFPGHIAQMKLSRRERNSFLSGLWLMCKTIDKNKRQKLCFRNKGKTKENLKNLCQRRATFLSSPRLSAANIPGKIFVKRYSCENCFGISQASHSQYIDWIYSICYRFSSRFPTTFAAETFFAVLLSLMLPFESNQYRFNCVMPLCGWFNIL